MSLFCRCIQEAKAPVAESQFSILADHHC
jgi:hypothetical protein